MFPNKKNTKTSDVPIINFYHASFKARLFEHSGLWSNKGCCNCKVSHRPGHSLSHSVVAIVTLPCSEFAEKKTCSFLTFQMLLQTLTKLGFQNVPKVNHQHFIFLLSILLLRFGFQKSSSPKMTPGRCKVGAFLWSNLFQAVLLHAGACWLANTYYFE